MKDLFNLDSPKISVIIPLYNHEKYIGEAIDSVLNQTIQDFELIILNDGSTDNSGGLAKEYNDKRIKYYSQDNKGAHHTINRGIELAKGHYISILNSDDVYTYNRLEACLDILEKDTSKSAVFSHMEWINENGSHIRFFRGAENNWLHHSPETSFKGENKIPLDLFAGNCLVTTSNLFCRKTVFEEIEGFRNLRYVHDHDFFLRLCLRFKCHILEDTLLKYRIHDKNTINENKPETFFEIGLVYADLMLNHNLKTILPNDNYFEMLVKIFHSINPYFSERMILTLLFQYMNNSKKEDFFDELANNPENPFRKTCIEYLRTRFEESIILAGYHDKCGQMESIINDQKISISELDRKFHETQYEVQKKSELLELYENSISLKAGRVLTWPVKKMIHTVKDSFFKEKNVNHKQQIAGQTLERVSSPEKSVPYNFSQKDSDSNDELIPKELKEAFNELRELYGTNVSHVFLVPWLVRGGSDLETLNYINTLYENKLSQNIVVIATENVPSPWKKRLPEKVRFINWGERYQHVAPEKQEVLLKTMLLEKRPHAVHNVNSDLGFRVLVKFGSELKKNIHLYACVFCEDITENGEYVGYSVWYVPKCYDYLDALLSDNLCHLKNLQNRFALDPSKMVVTYHPADIEINRGKSVNVHMNNDPMNILWAGRLDRQKRPDILIKVAELCKDLPFMFHVYGSPVLEKDLYTEKFEKIENIKYYGGYDKGLGSINTVRMDCYLYTSQWDGLPNVLIEAMALGVPVISSNVGGIGELISHGENGFLIEPFNDTEKYVECLLDIYKGKFNIPLIINNAFETIASRHSSEKFMEYIKKIPNYCLSTF